MIHSMKRITAASLIAASLLVPTAAAGAETMPVTRGEFIRLIAEQLHLDSAKDTQLPKDVQAGSPYAEAVKAMIERKALVGYDDGTFRLDRPITGEEASYVLARFLGMKEQGALKQLQDRFHVTFGDDLRLLSADTAKQLLQTTLKSEDVALQWMKQSADGQKAVDSFRADITIDMQMLMKAMKDQQAMTVDSKTTSQLEFQKDQGIHQQTVTEVQAPTGPVKVKMEQYTVTQGTYIEMPDPATGKDMWYDMSAQMPFTFQKLMDLQKSNAAVAEQWMLPYFFYRDLGTETVDGNKLHKIEVNGSVTDFNEMMNVFSKTTGDTKMADMLKSVPVVGNISMGMSGVFWFDESSRQVKQMDASYQIRFGDDPAMPLKEMDMSMKAVYKDYNTAIAIDLPEAAKHAVPLKVPTMQEQPVSPQAK